MEKCGKMCENVEKCAGDPFSIYYYPKGGGLRGNSPGIAASLISFLSMVALEESVGGAQRRGKFSSLEGEHAPSI